LEKGMQEWKRKGNEKKNERKKEKKEYSER